MGRETKVIKGKEDTVVLAREGNTLLSFSLKSKNVFSRITCDDTIKASVVFESMSRFYQDTIKTGRELCASAVLTAQYGNKVNEIAKSVLV